MKREKRIIVFKLNIKDDHVFNTDIQATYQKELYLLFEKSSNFFDRVNIEIGLTRPPPAPFHSLFKEHHPHTQPNPLHPPSQWTLYQRKSEKHVDVKTKYKEEMELVHDNASVFMDLI